MSDYQKVKTAKLTFKGEKRKYALLVFVFGAELIRWFAFLGKKKRNKKSTSDTKKMMQKDSGEKKKLPKTPKPMVVGGMQLRLKSLKVGLKQLA